MCPSLQVTRSHFPPGYLLMTWKKTKNLLIYDEVASLDRVGLHYYYKVSFFYRQKDHYNKYHQKHFF